MVSPQVYCDIEEVLMWFGGKDYSNSMPKVYRFTIFMKHRLTYAIRWRLFNAIPEKIKKKIVCVNMEKFQVRHLYNARRKVA